MAFGRLSAISSSVARLGDALSRAISESPGAVRYISTALWGLIAISAIMLTSIRERRAPNLIRIVAFIVFVVIALGDLFALWSTARLVAGWLAYQGA